MLPHYVELFCLSNFSFLHGASHAEELVARAVKLNYQALAITDECSLAGVVRAHEEAKKHNFPLLIGSYFQLASDAQLQNLRLVIIAQNREGYGNLCELITLARMRDHAIKGSYHLTPNDFVQPSKELTHLRGLPHCLIILLPDYPAESALLKKQAEWMATQFPGRAWLGLNLLTRAMDDIHQDRVQGVAHEMKLPVVAVGQVCMHVR